MSTPFKGKEAAREGSSFCLLVVLPMSLAKAGSHPAPLLPEHTRPAFAAAQMQPNKYTYATQQQAVAMYSTQYMQL